MGKAFQAHEFVLGPNHDGPSAVKMYTASPTQFEEDHLGQLFVLTELEQDDPRNEELIHYLEEEIKRNYYGQEHDDTGQNFEEALNKTNGAVAGLLEEFGSQFLEHLNILVVVLRGEELHLAYVGTIHALLIHNGKVLDILNAAGASRRHEVNPLKLFSNVIAGSVSENDTVVLSTTSALDYLSLEKIRKTYVDSSLSQGTEALKELLTDANPETLFCVVAFRVLSTSTKKIELPPMDEIPAARPIARASSRPISLISDEAERESETHQGKRYADREDREPEEHPSDDSLSELQEKERKTNTLLSSGLRNTVASALGTLSKKARSFRVRSESEESLNEEPLPARLRHRQQAMGKPRNIGSRVGRFMIFIVTSIVDAFVRTAKAILAFRPGRHSAGSWKGQRYSRSTQWIKTLKEQPLRTKLLLGAAVVFLFVFALIVTKDSAPDAEGNTAQDYQAMFASAQENVQEAEAVMIYGNEQDAKSLLAKAVTTLKQIPGDLGTLSTDSSALLSQTQTTLNRINGVTVLENPSPLANIANQFPAASVDHLALFQGNLWLTQTGDTALYEVNPTSGNVVDRQTNATHPTRVIVPERSTLLLIGDQGQATRYDPASDANSTVAITFTQQNPAIVDAQLFNGRLYTLDRQTGQIYRHDPTDKNFTEGVEWIQGTTRLQQPLSLTIDGSVYVSTAAGSIETLFTGALDTDAPRFSLEPAYGKNILLTSTELSPNLYIVDPENQRVVVLVKKTGAIRAQYTSTTFNQLRDVAVDESRNKIFVLNGTSVFELEIPAAQ